MGDMYLGIFRGPQTLLDGVVYDSGRLEMTRWCFPRGNSIVQ